MPNWSRWRWQAEAKAIKSDQLKTQLLANVSHELRAPLNIILGLSEMASASPSPYANELPAQLKKDLGYIYDSGEHLLRLINDLLDISRAEIGELDLAYEAVAPRMLLQEVFATFKKTSGSKLREVELISRHSRSLADSARRPGAVAADFHQSVEQRAQIYGARNNRPRR